MIDADSLLHVAIEATDTGLVTRIITSPVGQVQEPFLLPTMTPDLERFWNMAADLDDTADVDHRAWQETIQTVGEQLFRVLFAGSLMPALHNSIQVAYQEQGVLQLRLSLPDDHELLSLPWEILFDATRQEFLSLSPHLPLMRYVDRRQQIRPLDVEGPLRALVVIADAGGFEPINAGQEWLKLLDTLDYLGMDDRLVLERLDRPTLFALQRRLRQRPYHILHIIGHAVYNKGARDGRLVIEDEVGHGRMISGQHLGQLLRDHYATRLVILQSIDEEIDRRNPIGLAAYNLAPRGVPAAIALPHRLPDRLNLAFLHDLYTAVTHYRPIDVAVAEARSALASETPNMLWGAPWLVSRAIDGRIFDDGSRPPQPKPVQSRRQPSLLERVLSSNQGIDF